MLLQATAILFRMLLYWVPMLLRATLISVRVSFQWAPVIFEVMLITIPVFSQAPTLSRRWSRSSGPLNLDVTVSGAAFDVRESRV